MHYFSVKAVCLVADFVYYNPIDSAVNRSAKTQRPVRGRKIVITTGRSSRHDANSGSSALPCRGTRGNSRTAGRSVRGHGYQQKDAVTANVELVDEDEWEADDAGRIHHRLPQHTTEHGVHRDQINPGYCCYFLRLG